jgi:hypothetical protein
MVAAGGVQRNLASLSASWSSGAAGSETAYAQIEVAFGGSLGTCLDFVMADIPDCCVSMISNSAGNGAFIRSHRSSDGPGNYVANTTLTMQPSGTGDFRVLVGASYRFFATNTGTRLLGRLGLFGASEASQPGPYPDVAVSAGIAGADTVDAAAVLSALQDLQNTVNSLMAGLRTYGAIAT